MAVNCGKDSSTTPSGPPTTPPPTTPPTTPPPTTPPASATPTTIAITPATVPDLTRFGQTVQLAATVKDQNGSAMAGVAVTWISNNPQTATVSANGLVRAVTDGAVLIYATADAASGRISDFVGVQVVAGSPHRIENVPRGLPLLTRVGQSVQLMPVVKNVNNGTVNRKLTWEWESDDESVAVVDSTGLVAAVGNGDTYIRGRVRWVWPIGETEVSRNLLAQPVYVMVDLFDRHQKGILAQLYHATGGPNWTEDANWLTAAPLREWHGVETDTVGRVAKIDLASNNLEGFILPELEQLRHIEHLSLELNEGLTGILPGDLTTLGLSTLYLDGTGVCAPPETILQTWLKGIPNRRVADCVPVDFGRSKAYLTQATQSFSRPVPLVAGERAQLRVFVVADAEDADSEMTVPPVRATFYRDGAEIHVVDMPEMDVPVPTRVDEATPPEVTPNAEVPGQVIMPGLEMVVEIDPGDETGSAPGTRLPPTGRTPIDVKDVPPLDLTLVPFLWEEDPDRSVLTQTEGLTAESDLFWQTRDLLPVREFQLEVRDYVWIPVDPDPVVTPYSELLSLTAMVRATDGATGHYLGILRTPGGVADWRGFYSVSALDGWTIAHELGHNMSLRHAPCAVLTGPNEYYPHELGAVGSYGWDFDFYGPGVGRLVLNHAPDLMSYCQNRWIGAYSFTKALNYRVSLEGLPAPEELFASRSLLVWGGVDENGALFLEPAFMVDAPASPPGTNGPYRLEGESTEGAALFSLGFAMPEFVHDLGEGGGAFAFVLPVRSDWNRTLARVTLSGPEGVVELNGEGDHASALLVDSVTGRVRGYLEDWPAPGASGSVAARRVLPEPGLDVTISRGLPVPASRER